MGDIKDLLGENPKKFRREFREICIQAYTTIYRKEIVQTITHDSFVRRLDEGGEKKTGKLMQGLRIQRPPL